MNRVWSITGFLAAGTLGVSIMAGSPAVADDPIIIGAAIAQSGVVAPYDEGPAQAMEVAVDEINAKGGLLGKQLKIIYADTKSDIAYGATAAQEVIDKGAKMVVVTCDYDFGSAAASVADSAGLIAFSTCAGDPKFGPSGIGPNAFTMATGAPGQAVAMAEWAYNVKGWRTGYILLDTTIAFDATWADFFKKRWIELAGEQSVLGQDTFGGEDPQIASQITRIKSLPKQPDFIVLCSFPPAGVSATRQLRAADVKQPLLGSESWDGDFWLEGVPNLNEFYFVTYGSVFGNDPRPNVAQFFANFQKKWNHAPVTSHAITGYSVIQAWSRAVTTAGTFDTDKVRDALQHFKDEPLLAGPTTFTTDQHINMQRDLLLIEVKDGKTGNIVQVVRAEKMPN
jgi:branched-chain amino acid transport system substrate-binding protein